MKISFNYSRANLLLTDGMDLIQLYLDREHPTAFPTMDFETCIKIDAERDEGKEWCDKMGIEIDTIKNIRVRDE